MKLPRAVLALNLTQMAPTKKKLFVLIDTDVIDLADQISKPVHMADEARRIMSDPLKQTLGGFLESQLQLDPSICLPSINSSAAMAGIEYLPKKHSTAESFLLPGRAMLNLPFHPNGSSVDVLDSAVVDQTFGTRITLLSHFENALKDNEHVQGLQDETEPKAQTQNFSTQHFR